MIETDIAQELSNKLGLVLGQDIFVGSLPLDQDVGVFIKVLDEKEVFGSLRGVVIGIFVIKDNYAEARELASQIRDVLAEHKGMTEASGYSSRGSVEIVNLDTNVEGNFVFCVTSYLDIGG